MNSFWEKCNKESYIYDKKTKEPENQSYKYSFYENLKDWKEKYIDYKKGVTNKNPYHDPDEMNGEKGAWKTVDNLDYYKDITKFLQSQESKRKQNGEETIISYEAPQMGEDIEPPYDRTITVKKGNEKILHLTSDQFGFSEEGHNYRYPYYALMGKSKNPDETLEFIAECLYYTRSIGGAFLWPKIKEGRAWTSPYNRGRGTKTYIRDRVDLTLWEICQAYNKNEKLQIFSYKDRNEIKEWLGLFGSFDGYVDYFKFDAFVMKNKDGITVPINIIESDLSIYERVPIDEVYVNGLINKEKDNIESLEYDKLKIMLKNVIAMTKKRSKDMWEIINENQ